MKIKLLILMFLIFKIVLFAQTTSGGYLTVGNFNTQSNSKFWTGGIVFIGKSDNSNLGGLVDFEFIQFNKGEGVINGNFFGDNGGLTYTSSPQCYSINLNVSALYNPISVWNFYPFVASGLGISVLICDRGVPEGYYVVKEGLTGQKVGSPVYGILTAGTYFLVANVKEGSFFERLRFLVKYQKAFFRDGDLYNYNGDTLVFGIGLSLF
jgi:hypothetical protein